MVFFDKKEEVIDVQLTQYGKHLLARGKFRPVYYCFYDDDILYDSSKAGFSEEQNDTQKRILEDTPRLKTQYINYGINTFNNTSQPEAEDPFRDASAIFQRSRDDVFFDNTLKDRDLLYKLADKEITTQDAPNYDVISLDSEFINVDEVGYQDLVSLGIIENIPQLESTVSPLLIKNTEDQTSPRIITREDNFDPTSDRLVFADNTRLELEKKTLTLSIEEGAVYDGKENFTLEIYEMHDLPAVPDREGDSHFLRKINSMEEINYLFHIKTDESVDQEVVEHRTQRQRNNQRRQD